MVTDQWTTGIILAGGQSSRMGADKASLPWGEGDLLNAQLSVLTTICEELIVVSNSPREIRLPGVRLVPDEFASCGPLGGLEAGLAAARTEVCFAVACDMPFLDAGSVQYLTREVAEFDAAVPFVGDRWHPLYAAYRTTCLPLIRSQLQAGRFRMSELLGSIRVRPVGAEELVGFCPKLSMLQNINTPEEWQKVRK